MVRQNSHFKGLMLLIHPLPVPEATAVKQA